MKKYLLIILIILSTIPAIASDWRYIGNGGYIDLESISKYPNSYLYPNNNMYTFWTKQVNDGSKNSKNSFDKIERIAGNIKLKEVQRQDIIDCSKKKIALTSIIVYKLDGSPSFNFSFNEFQYQWNNIVPDSYGEFFYKVICQSK